MNKLVFMLPILLLVGCKPSMEPPKPGAGIYRTYVYEKCVTGVKTSHDNLTTVTLDESELELNSYEEMAAKCSLIGHYQAKELCEEGCSVEFVKETIEYLESL